MSQVYPADASRLCPGRIRHQSVSALPPAAGGRAPSGSRVESGGQARGLRWLDYARTHSVAATCRHFGIARSTFYRWQRRYRPDDLTSLGGSLLAPEALSPPDVDADAGRRRCARRGQPIPAGARTSWPSCCGGRGSSSPSR